MPGGCVGLIGVLTGAGADGPGVDDGDANGAGAGGGPLGEVGVKVPNSGFLPKSESTSCLI